MVKKLSKPKAIGMLLAGFLAPLPTYAIDATGSGNFWGIVFGFFIVSFFLVFSIIPWLTYRAIKNGRIFWIVVTMILCTTGIFYSFRIYREIFGDSEMGGIGFLTFLVSVSVYIVLFFKTLYKISELRSGLNSIPIESDLDLHSTEPGNDQEKTRNFNLYQKFSNEQNVSQLIELLEKNKIEYQMENHSPVSDIIFSPNEHEKEFWLKLKNEDFETVDNIQSNFLNRLIETIDPGYYLFGFSNQELSEVIKNPNEWSKLDFLLAQKIVRDRKE